MASKWHDRCCLAIFDHLTGRHVMGVYPRARPRRVACQTRPRPATRNLVHNRIGYHLARAFVAIRHEPRTKTPDSPSRAGLRSVPRAPPCSQMGIRPIDDCSILHSSSLDHGLTIGPLSQVRMLNACRSTSNPSRPKPPRPRANTSDSGGVVDPPYPAGNPRKRPHGNDEDPNSRSARAPRSRHPF